jgi:hypothetical protein
MSCETRWHSLQSTFRQDVGNLPIGGGVSGARNDGGDGGVTGEAVGGVAGVSKIAVGSGMASGAMDGGDAGSVGRAVGS